MQIQLHNFQGKHISLSPTPVDQVGAEERAAFFTSRSIKKESKLEAYRLIVSMIDLTTLEGGDTPGKVIPLCRKAIEPVAESFLFKEKKYLSSYEIPSVAAICVYPNMLPFAKEVLKGSSVKLASVATSFPAGQVPLEIRLSDVKEAVRAGADEIDMVMNRSLFLTGKYQKVVDEILAVKKACSNAHLKVILETGELGSLDKVRLASHIAMEAGADFIKTSTGKLAASATLPSTLVMLQSIGDFYEKTGRKVGMKPAGGIRTAKQAIHYLCMVKEILGEEWLTPKLFRFGASSLLNDVLKQIFTQLTGRYYYEKIFSVD